MDLGLPEGLAESLAGARPVGLWPTPLEERGELGLELGVDLAFKREDRIDDLGGGHKVRKLAFMLPEMEAQGATVLLTAGSLPSTQAVAVARLARRLGLRAHVVYLGDEQTRPAAPSGAYLQTLLAGPDVTWFERRPWVQAGDALREVERMERDRGERPFIIEPGCSNAGGLTGSLALGIELAGQLPPDPRHLIVPVGSGGALIGLVAAATLLGRPWTVHGICVATDARATAAGLGALWEGLGRWVPGPLPKERIMLHDMALCGGYGRTTPGLLAEARRLAACHGVLFDPIYLTKAWLGLRELVSRAVITQGANVVFVHTGGTAAAFDTRAWGDRSA